MNSKALSRIQSIILAAIILSTVVGGSAIYLLWSGTAPSAETIKIGICGDLDNVNGKTVWQGAVLAAEQVNAEGGVLGRTFEIIAEDDQSEVLPMDLAMANSAMIELITLDKADFLIASAGPPITLTYQELCAQHKKILFTTTDISNTLTKRVLEDYDTYKYYFRGGTGNATNAHNGRIDSLITLRNYTGFNKVAFLVHNFGMGMEKGSEKLQESLIANGFEIVYGALVPFDTFDFTSYFVAVEESGAQILNTFIVGDAATSLVKEWYERKSPFVLWGVLSTVSQVNAWDEMEGKCEFVSTVGNAIISGYPLTSKTLSTSEVYFERWGEVANWFAAQAYDIVRFILPDALKRAGTIETEAVIKALEETDIETTCVRRFVFTSEHDIMVGEGSPTKPDLEYAVGFFFQWQNGKQVIVYPKEIMEEVGATYIYPDWPGPWD